MLRMASVSSFLSRSRVFRVRRRFVCVRRFYVSLRFLGVIEVWMFDVDRGCVLLLEQDLVLLLEMIFKAHSMSSSVLLHSISCILYVLRSACKESAAALP